jgi:hypothetical protein
MAFRKTCSARLIEESDDFTDLSSSPKFLLGRGQLKIK